MEKSFTISQIKAAFWEQFHKAGELWFDYLGSEEDNQSCTNGSWEEFLESLEKSAQHSVHPTPLRACVCGGTK
jgi:hypothetical protein